MNTSEILNKAADILQVRGWAGGVGAAQGWHPNPAETTPVCVEGALRLANGTDWRPEAAVDALRDYLRDLYPECINPHCAKGIIVFAWNDQPGRTESEVIEVLRACAVIEASRERQTVPVSSVVAVA
jgi:hypothetical protein